MKEGIRILLSEDSPAIRRRVVDYTRAKKRPIDIEDATLLPMDSFLKDLNFDIYIVQISKLTPVQRQHIEQGVKVRNRILFGLYDNQFEKILAQNMGAQFLLRRQVEDIPSFFLALKKALDVCLTQLSVGAVLQDDNRASQAASVISKNSQVNKKKPCDKGIELSVKPFLQSDQYIVAIGASTGGLEALRQIVPKLTDETAPILVAVHLPEGFVGGMKRQLQDLSDLDVDIAKEGEILIPGMLRIAPSGDTFLGVKIYQDSIYTTLQFSPRLNAYREQREYQRFSPSIDYMFDSLAVTCPQHSVGVVLTGMGDDGVKGLLHIRKNGGYTLCQDESTSLVYGMPKRALKEGAAINQASLLDIPDTINEGLLMLHKQNQEQRE